MEWIGGEFDPEEFDLDEVNTALLSIKPTHRSRKSKIELELEDVDDEVDNFMPSTKDEKAAADALAVSLRRGRPRASWASSNG